MDVESAYPVNPIGLRAGVDRMALAQPLWHNASGLAATSGIERSLMPGKRYWNIWALAALMLLLCPLGAAAEHRVALVIGNAAYQNTAALANPGHDAEDMAAALKRLGFTVFSGNDLNKRGMERALAGFARAARDADAALFYYAGHAMQYNGINYLVPTDARLEDEFSVNFEVTRLDDVLESLGRTRGVKILILDACRRNPLVEKLAGMSSTRDFIMARGLARLDATRGMVVAYSTQANQVAIDGTGRNSPFTAALLSQLNEPGLEIATLFRRVAIDVNRATEGRQVPELSISLLGEFFFNRADTDLQAWSKLRRSRHVAELQTFIDRYPSSPLVTDAQERIAALDLAARQAAERVTRERAERERIEREKETAQAVERERIAREKAEQERRVNERAEQERLAREAAERERIEQDKEAARQAAERERIAREKAEQERVARELAEQERLALETAERERIEKERQNAALATAERERVARERVEQEKLAQEAAERERLAREQAERERLAREQGETARPKEEAKVENVGGPAQAEQVEQQTPSASPAEIQTAVLVEPPKPVSATPSPLTGSALVAEIKKELQRVGCYGGSLDGKWTTAETTSSVQKFVKYANLPSLPPEPALELLEALRGKSERVCPVICSARQVLVGERCVPKSCPRGSILNADGDCERQFRPKTAARPPAERASSRDADEKPARRARESSRGPAPEKSEKPASGSGVIGWPPPPRGASKYCGETRC